MSIPVDASSAAEGESDGLRNDAARQASSNIPSLVCAFTASATTGGTAYAFGLYASALKRTLHLSQGQLDSISTAFFVAGLFSFLPGLCSDRYGTRWAMSLGGATGAASLLLYWLVARQLVLVPRSYLVSVLSGLGVTTFLSCALVTGAVFKIIVSCTGAGTKGSAVGAAKGYVGLGAGLYACLFQALQARGQSDLDFLPMAALLFLLCATLPALCLLPNQRQAQEMAATLRDDCTPLHFRALYCSLVTLAMIIISNSLRKLYDSERQSSSGTSYGMAFLLLFVWLGPIVSLSALPREAHSDYDALAGPSRDDDERPQDAAFRNEAEEAPIDALKPRSKPDEKRVLLRVGSNSGRRGGGGGTMEETTLLRTDAVASAEPDALLHTVRNDPGDDDEEEVHLNVLQMLQTPTALPMLWTTVLLVGAGTLETNNMGQMVESLGFDASVTSAALAFFSVAQAASRVGTGSLSEAALHWSAWRGMGIPRPFFLVVAAVVGVVAHALLAVAHTEWAFCLGVTLAGLAFGMVWPLMVLISAEVFGVAGAGQNYMFFDGVSSAGGTLLLTKFVASAVYDRHTDKQEGADARTCLGRACFASTHWVVAGLCVSCILSSVILLYTSRHVYNKARFHVH